MARVENLAAAMLGCMEADLKKAVATKPVAIVVFTQKGCSHCADQKKALSSATNGRRDVRVLEVSCDDDRCGSLTRSVQATPTTLYFAGGKKVARVMGTQPIGAITKNLNGASAVVSSKGICKVNGSAKDRLACMTKH